MKKRFYFLDQDNNITGFSLTRSNDEQLELLESEVEQFIFPMVSNGQVVENTSKLLENKWNKLWLCVKELFEKTSFMEQKFNLYKYAVEKQLPVDEIGITEQNFDSLVLWWDRLRRVSNNRQVGFNIDDYSLDEIVSSNIEIFGQCPIEFKI